MDDANVPVSLSIVAHSLCSSFPQSLLSLPYLGFLERDDPAYKATRELLLSGKNPYYAAGRNFSGVGCVVDRICFTWLSDTALDFEIQRPSHYAMASMVIFFERQGRSRCG